MSLNIKKQTLECCQNWVNQREAQVLAKISELNDVLGGSHKSTAGDKHNTERAMLQIQQEQLGQQLQLVQKDQQILERIKKYQKSEKAHLGSLVITSNGIYFLSVSAGQIALEKEVVMAVSVVSPIGKLLMGKQVGDSLAFRTTEIAIQHIV